MLFCRFIVVVLQLPVGRSCADYSPGGRSCRGARRSCVFSVMTGGTVLSSFPLFRNFFGSSHFVLFFSSFFGGVGEIRFEMEEIF